MIRNKKAFTVIELSIVLGLICVLSILAIPRFSDLLRKSRENETRAALSSLRNAIHSYYEQSGGNYPTNLESKDFLGKYLQEILPVKLGKYHDNSNRVKTGGKMNDHGGWYYEPTTGVIIVNCSHKDTKEQSIDKW